VSYVRDEIKKFSQKYADRMEEYNNLVKQVKTRQFKRKLPQDLCTRSYYDLMAYAIAYALEDFYKLSNVTQSDSL